MDFSPLFKLDTPLAFKIITDEREFGNMCFTMTLDYPKSVIRMIRGKKSLTVEDFFNEISAALQFPYYFGENGAALNDCIQDLEWIFGDAYILMISDAELFLKEAPGAFETIMEIMADAQRLWLNPNEYDDRDRQPTPFHLFFHSADPDCPLFNKLAALDYPLEELKP